MKSHSVVITEEDMDRLSRLVRALKHSLFRDRPQLESLEQTLEGAEVKPSQRIPRNVIRMNSSIRVLDLDTQKKELYTLVFPESADISTSRISVLAPLGIALLGHVQRDLVEPKVPGGARRLRVERVWQSPELTKRPARPDRPKRPGLRRQMTRSMSLTA
jgi:regulator of nucleoside diphosphate kinase